MIAVHCVLVSRFFCGSASEIFVVLHTSPRSDSRLADILGRSCRLPVRLATDAEPIAIGEVRVAPPDLHLSLDAARTHLDRGPVQNRVRPAVDALFRSAAVAHGAATIGVVLTGSLSDDSAGLAAIKRCGGFTIVQQPEDAAFPGMPRSAIATDSPDVVVPLAEIAGQIVDAVHMPDTAGPSNDGDEQVLNFCYACQPSEREPACRMTSTTRASKRCSCS